MKVRFSGKTKVDAIAHMKMIKRLQATFKQRIRGNIKRVDVKIEKKFNHIQQMNIEKQQYIFYTRRNKYIFSES